MADFDAQVREPVAQMREAKVDERFARRFDEIVKKHDANAYGG